MSREIKFRFWDKQEKKYYEPTFAAYKGDLDDMMITPRGDLCKHPLNYERGSLMVHESMFPDRYTLEQYTGLKDKNDKEIYFESDIVRIECTDDYSGESTYMEGVLYLSLKRFKICLKGYESFSLQFADYIEIIGNIHEEITC